jgi:CxxC motif-containing protein (DUF1111 family)
MIVLEPRQRLIWVMHETAFDRTNGSATACRKRLAIAPALLTVLATAAAFAADGDAERGRALFERDWVGGPASDAGGGLGPLFGARSCAGCHAGDALGARFTPAPGGRIAGRGLVVRLGDGEGRPDPVYGHVLQVQAVEGLAAEARIVLTIQPGDSAGMQVELHLEQGDLAATTRRSVRQAPPLAGRAGLERIDAASVLARADPDDRDGDGISGRARMVSVDGAPVLGRYGWKAGVASLEGQIADAFATEIGLSSDRRPSPHGDCTELQQDCLAAATAGDAAYEVSAGDIRLVAAYLRSIGGSGPSEMPERGGAVFAAAGCATCHVPEMPGGDGAPVRAFTDLLLHDMGDELDDGVGEPGIASSEWRTAPLLALAPTNGRRYLHDASAATLGAAILKHGGEASAARSAYAALPDADRRALIAFLEAL